MCSACTSLRVGWAHLLRVSSRAAAFKAVLAARLELWVFATGKVRGALIDVLRRAKNDRDSLVNVHRWDVHHAAVASDSLATSLLQDEGHGGALVEETQLAVLVLRVCWVREDAAVEQRAVHVADHGSNVAERVRGLGLTLALLNGVDVVLHRLIPIVHVRLVARVNLAALGDLDAGAGQLVVSDVHIKGETDDPAAEGQDQLRGGGVEAVARADQVLARLQGLGQARELGLAQVGLSFRQDAVNVGVLLEDTKDRANRHTGINIAAPVKRVEHADVVAALANHLGIEFVVEVIISTSQNWVVLLL
mmetsp:Transcript_70650/g.160453  ORF Transcript_70650/g.160453 Transcript_70650/m.160453 type:complete len:306 (+) Transcript_70650:159-1076(+)